MENVLYYSGSGNYHLAAAIIRRLSEYLGKERNFSHIDIGEFDDDECDNKFPNYSEIAGKTVVYFQSIYRYDLMEEALDSIWAIKRQYQAKYLIAVIPFMMFRRQDHDEKPEEICRLRMIIDRLKNAGVDEIITVSPHSVKMQQFCTEYGIIMREVDPSPLFASTIKAYLPDTPTIYAPDKGSIPRAISLAKLTGSSVIFSLKERGLNNEAKIKPEQKQEIADTISFCKREFNFSDVYYADREHIKEQSIVVTEDEVTSGKTANTTCERLKSLGASTIIFLAIHAVLVNAWRRRFLDKFPYDKIILGDTIPRDYKKRTGGLIHDISVDELVAQVLYKSLQQGLRK